MHFKQALQAFNLTFDKLIGSRHLGACHSASSDADCSCEGDPAALPSAYDHGSFSDVEQSRDAMPSNAEASSCPVGLQLHNRGSELAAKTDADLLVESWYAPPDTCVHISHVPVKTSARWTDLVESESSDRVEPDGALTKPGKGPVCLDEAGVSSALDPRLHDCKTDVEGLMDAFDADAAKEILIDRCNACILMKETASKTALRRDIVEYACNYPELEKACREMIIALRDGHW